MLKINKIVYKKWTKIPKNEKNDQCGYMNIFKRIVNISYCFRRLKYTYWATSHPNIMIPKPIQQKGPTFLGNCCLFSHF